MDINYILAREQEALYRADTSPSRSARASHREFAKAYRQLLVDSAYPHTLILTNKERRDVHRQRAFQASVHAWEDEGGSVD